MALTPFQRAMRLADSRGISLAAAANLLETDPNAEQDFDRPAPTKIEASNDDIRGAFGMATPKATGRLGDLDGPSTGPLPSFRQEANDPAAMQRVATVRNEDAGRRTRRAERAEDVEAVEARVDARKPQPDVLRDWGKSALDFTLHAASDQSIEDMAQTATSGLVASGGMALSGMAEGSDAITRSLRRLTEKVGAEKAFDVLMAPAEWLGITRNVQNAGEGIEAAAERMNIAPERREESLNIVANALGQVTGQVALTLVAGPEAGGIAYLGQGFDQMADALRAKGKEGTAAGDVATLVAAPVMSMLEKTGIDRILAKAPEAVKNRVIKGFMDIAIAGGTEAATEIGEQFVQNFAIKLSADPDQDLTEGFNQSAIGGGGAGAIARGVALAVGGRRSRLTPQDRASPLEDADIEQGKADVAEALGDPAPDYGVDDDPAPVVRTPYHGIMPKKATTFERALKPAVEGGRNARQVLKAKIRGVESSGDDTAQNARSSASGRYQFIDGTFRSLYKRVYGQSLDDAGLAAVKDNPVVQERLMDALVADNEAALRRAGFDPTAGNLYLAHFLGPQGAINALKNPGASPSASVVKANPNLAGMTNAEVAQWAAKKMGGKGGAAVSSDPTDDGTIDYGDAEYEARVAARQAREDAALAEADATIRDGAAREDSAASERARTRIDEAKANNVAAEAAVEAQTEKAKAATGQQPNEEPVFESAEEGARQVAWQNTETGELRPYDEAAPAPETGGAAVGEPAPVTAGPGVAAATTPPIQVETGTDLVEAEPAAVAPVATPLEGDFGGEKPGGVSTPTPVATDSSSPLAEILSDSPASTVPAALPVMNEGPGPRTVQSAMQGVIAAQASDTPNLPAIEEAVGRDPEVARYDSGEIKYAGLSGVAKQLVDARSQERNFSALAESEPGITRAAFEQRRADGMAFAKTFLKQGGLDAAPVSKQDALKSKMAAKRGVAKAVAPAGKKSSTRVAPPVAASPAPAPAEGAAVSTPPVETAATPQDKLKRKAIEKAKEAISRKASDIDETLTNYGYENDKPGLKRALARLVKQGVLDQSDVDAVAPIFKDKDMDAEDVVSEVQGAVQDWADRETAAIDPQSVKRKQRVEEGRDNAGRRTDREAGSQPTTAPVVQDDSGVRGGIGLLEQSARADAVNADPLAGSPAASVTIGDRKVAIGPSKIARQAARAWAAMTGLPARRQGAYVKVDKARATRIADAYEAMAHDPTNPEVRAAYDALVRETISQWEVIKLTGLKVEFVNFAEDGDPYAATPRLAQADVAENNHLWVFNTEDGYGQEGITAEDEAENPMLAFVPGEVISGRPARVNDIFRIVHDYFGHIKDGHGFRAEGEENAWQSHAAMYSAEARRAMTVETRGQNSWVNFGPHAEANRTASAGETVYAPQKVGLLPQWAVDEGRTVAIDKETTDDATATGPGVVGETGNAGLETPPVNEDGTITLDHFSFTEGLTESDPTKWGTNSAIFSRSERATLDRSPPRTYFGIATDQPGGYKNEFFNAIPYRAEVQADRLYDVAKDPDGLWVPRKSWLGEQAIKDAGYAGYWLKHGELGLVAVVFEPVAIAPVAAMPAQRRGVDSGQSVVDQIEAVRAEVLATLRSMGAEGRVNIEVLNSIPDENGGGGQVAGDYAPWLNLIRVSLMGNDSAAHTTRHELIHWMRENGVLNRTEWSVVRKWAEAQPELQAWVDKYYEGLTQDERSEEMVAEGIARALSLRTGTSGIVQRAIAKVRDLINAILEAFGKSGISRADLAAAMAIIDRIETGEQIELADTRGKADATRTARLRADLIAGRITPQEHHYFTMRPSVKYQAAWHGTPANGFDRFDLNYLGTGEGAQAFGWGLYFAQSKDIATFYRTKLSERLMRADEAVMASGVALKDYFAPGGFGDNWGAYNVASAIADFLDANAPYNGWLEGVKNKALNEYDKAIADNEAALANMDAEGGLSETERLERGAIVEEIENLKRGLVLEEAMFNQLAKEAITMAPRPKGVLFGVEIPETEDLLDFDATLDKQSPKVKAALAKLKAAIPEDALEEYEERLGDFDEWTGLELQKRVLPRMAIDDTYPVDAPQEVQDALDNGESAKAASLYLKSLGIPGNSYLDSNSRGQGTAKTRNFVIFDDSLVEIRSKQRRQSPLNEPDPAPSLLRDMGNATAGLISALRWRGDEAGAAFDKWRTALQDKMLPLLRIQSRIEAALGRPLTDDEDPYSKETLYSSRVGDQLGKLTDDYVEPLLIDLHATGISVDELDEYLYARHAFERNAHVHSINPHFGPDEGSGMTNAEAAQVMSDVRASGRQADFDALAAHVDRLVEFSIQTRVNGGLLSQADADILRNTYRYYVPLRGHEELDPKESGSSARAGKGINITGSETRRAFGRDSKANDLLGHTILQAEEAIVRAEKNQVAVAFANLATANPEPGFWQINPVAQVRTLDTKTGMVVTSSRPMTESEKARTVSFKVDGVEQRVLIDPDGNNATAQRLAASMRNIGPAQMNDAVAMMATIGRYLSLINTSFNPEFVISNALRDLQTASLNLTQHEMSGMVRGVLKDWASMKPLISAHRGERGKLGSATWDVWVERFNAAGGKVHFNQMDNIDGLRTRLNKELARKGQSKWNTLRQMRALKNTIENANGAVENAIRVATFKNAVELGKTEQQAAYMAKNVTVNFNRHGTIGPAINALYVFANASIQGSTIMLQAIGKSRKVQVAVGSMVVMGLALDMLNRWLDDDDDDGQSFYSKIPEYEKSRNIIVMAPWLGKGKYVKMPMTWGYNVFPGLGRLISERMNGNRTTASALGAMATMTLDAFNPIGGTNSWLNLLAPSVLDPVVDIHNNTDFAGRPISPDQPVRAEDREPNSQLAWPQTHKIWKTVAEMMNALGGGDEVTPSAVGFMDNSPETLEHLSSVVVGAAGSFAGRLASLATRGFDPEMELTANDIPFKRKVVGDPPSWRDASSYYQRMQAVEYAVDRLKRYREAGDTEGEAKLNREDGDLLPMAAATKAARKTQKDLNKEKRAVAKQEKLGKITEEQAVEYRKGIKERQAALVLAFNQRWIGMIGEKREVPEE